MTSAKMILRLACVAAIAAAAPAQATIFSFSVGDLDWQIDTDQAPFAEDADGITYAGVDTTTTIGTTSADIDFFSQANGGGLRITDFTSGDILGWFAGQGLYSSAGGKIAFATGSFTLDPVSPSTAPATIAISAVPDTDSWMLMIAGFGMTGAAMRSYRRRRTDAAIAA